MLLLFIYGYLLAQKLFRAGLVALYRERRINPFLFSFAVLIGIEDGVVFSVFLLQAACHFLYSPFSTVLCLPLYIPVYRVELI